MCRNTLEEGNVYALFAIAMVTGLAFRRVFVGRGCVHSPYNSGQGPYNVYIQAQHFQDNSLCHMKTFESYDMSKRLGLVGCGNNHRYKTEDFIGHSHYLDNLWATLCIHVKPMDASCIAYTHTRVCERRHLYTASSYVFVSENYYPLGRIYGNICLTWTFLNDIFSRIMWHHFLEYPTTINKALNKWRCEEPPFLKWNINRAAKSVHICQKKKLCV